MPKSYKKDLHGVSVYDYPMNMDDLLSRATVKVQTVTGEGDGSQVLDFPPDLAILPTINFIPNGKDASISATYDAAKKSLVVKASMGLKWTVLCMAQRRDSDT